MRSLASSPLVWFALSSMIGGGCDTVVWLISETGTPPIVDSPHEVRERRGKQISRKVERPVATIILKIVLTYFFQMFPYN